MKDPIKATVENLESSIEVSNQESSITVTNRAHSITVEVVTISSITRFLLIGVDSYLLINSDNDKLKV